MKRVILLALIVMTCSCKRGAFEFEEFAGVNPDSVQKIEGRLEKPATEEIIKIKLPDVDFREKIPLTMDEYIDSIRVVRLQTTKESVVGYVNKMEISDDTIFICDSWKGRSVKTFTMEGEYIRNIGKRGRGPFEYVDVTSMQVTDTQVIIFDQILHKIMIFRHDGTPVLEKRVPFICQDVLVNNDSTYLFHGVEEQNYHLPEILNHDFWETDTSIIIRRRGLYRPNDKYMAYISSQSFFKGDGETYYFDNVSDTIYQVTTSNELKPRYCFELPYDSHSLHYVKKLRDPKASEMPQIAFCKFFRDYLYYIVCANKQRTCHVLHNLKSGKDILVNSTDMRHSNLSRILFLKDVDCTYKDEIVFQIPAESIVYERERAKAESDWWEDAPEAVKKFDEDLMDIDEMDNPILVFATLKKEEEVEK